MTDFEVGPERLDPELEMALEALGPEVMNLIDQVSERYQVSHAKVVALGVVSLYNQLNLHNDGKVILVVDAPAIKAFSDPIDAIAFQDSTGILKDVLDQIKLAHNA